MTHQKKYVNLTVILLIALTAAVSGIFFAQHLEKGKKFDVSQFQGTWLNPPRNVNAFSLTGVDEVRFDEQSLHGRCGTFVFFGFTNCGYLCPTTMSELAKMYRILEQKKINPLPRVVMISIDPQRDSLEKLKGYVHSFHPDFYGARGEMEAVEKMTREMGIAYSKPDSNSPQKGDIQHGGAIMLFNPQGELNAFFTTPRADSLAQDYQMLVG